MIQRASSLARKTEAQPMSQAVPSSLMIPNVGARFPKLWPHPSGCHRRVHLPRCNGVYPNQSVAQLSRQRDR